MNVLKAMWTRLLSAYAEPASGKVSGPEPLPNEDIKPSDAHPADQHGWEAHGSRERH